MPLLAWRTYKPNRTFWVLLIALATGVSAAVLARQYLSEQVAHIESRNRGATVSLLVAKSDLSVGARLTNQTVAVRPVPQDHAHSAAIRPEQFDRIDGQSLQHPLKAGDAVLWQSLETPRPSTFSARVAPGRRAITIPVDDINAMAGMLEPGDTIDLLLALDLQGRKHTITLLGAVQVLATGQRAAEAAGPAGQGQQVERRLYTTVTLDTTPQQARNLVLARELGRLTALLRRPGDHMAHPPPPLDLAAWLAEQTPTPARPMAAAAEVPVLYGGRATNPSGTAYPGLRAITPVPATHLTAGTATGPTLQQQVSWGVAATPPETR